MIILAPETTPTADAYQLGAESGLISLTSVDEFTQFALNMATQAHRTIDIFSHDLDHPLYDQSDFVVAIKELSLRSRFSQIRILLQNNRTIRRKGHRLVHLAQRLTSSIEIRRPGEPLLKALENFLLADEYGYIHRKMASYYEGRCDFNDRLRVAQLAERFNEAWESGEPDRELLRLYL